MSLLPSVPEQQSSQVLELYNCIVCESSCLVAFFSLDPDTNVGRLYHIHVVESITNCQNCLLVFELTLDKIGHYRFLHRRRSIHDQRICLEKNILFEACNSFFVEQ